MKTPQQRRVAVESYCECRKRYVFSFVLNVASDMFSLDKISRVNLKLMIQVDSKTACQQCCSTDQMGTEVQSGEELGRQ